MNEMDSAINKEEILANFQVSICIIKGENLNLHNNKKFKKNHIKILYFFSKLLQWILQVPSIY